MSRTWAYECPDCGHREEGLTFDPDASPGPMTCPECRASWFGSGAVEVQAGLWLMLVFWGVVVLASVLALVVAWRVVS